MRTSDKSTHLAIRRRATRPEDQTLTANLSGCDVVRLNGVLLSDDCCYTSVTEMLLNECFATQLTFRRISGPIINVCPHEGGLTVIGRARQCSHILKKKSVVEKLRSKTPVRAQFVTAGMVRRPVTKFNRPKLLGNPPSENVFGSD